MDHTVENKHFPGVFEATPLRAPVRPWGHAPRQANPVLTQGRRGAQGRDTPPIKVKVRGNYNWATVTHPHPLQVYNVCKTCAGILKPLLVNTGWLNLQTISFLAMNFMSLQLGRSSSHINITQYPGSVSLRQ